MRKPNALDVELGKKLRAIRERKKRNQTWLGESVGVSLHQIQKYEKGQNRVSFSRLCEFAHVLDVSVFSFFGEEQLQEHEAYVLRLEAQLNALYEILDNATSEAADLKKAWQRYKTENRAMLRGKTAQ